MLNRNILFQGLRVDGEGMIIGDLVHSVKVLNGTSTRHTLIGTNMEFEEVIPTTVGQYIEKYDKNGILIFEGDKVRLDNGTEGIVIFHNGCYAIRNDTFIIIPSWEDNENLEVIGNIYNKANTNE